MRKPICRQSEALRRLETLVAKLSGEGQVFLPAERLLCDMVGTSRKTLQKALKELEASGVLETGSRGRVISAEPHRESKGSILFIAGGVNWIVLPAWNRLWTAFEAQARAHGWSCERKLFVSNTKFDAAELEGTDFIVYSDVGGAWHDEFKRFARGAENIIGAQENHTEFLKRVVCLDNRAAGRVAAKLLLDAGYRKPALLRQENGYLGFVQREQGFREGIAAALPGYDVPSLIMRGNTVTRYIQDYLDKIGAFCASDIDSLFAVSDGLIDLVYDPFAHTRDIPAEFGLVTLAGSHECLIHHPPITAVTHGSSRVAQGIIELIERIKAGEQPDKPSLTLVEPGVHAGATVREPTRSL